MSSYNTIPDLESEAQPLVAAPARKLGKTLVVVALFGFAAGAAAATAAPHVATKMNFGTIINTKGGVETGPCKPGDSDCIIKKGGTVNQGNDSGLHEDGAPTDGVTTEPDTAQFQMSTEGGVEAMSADCGDASNGGGEHVGNPGCNKATSNAGKAGTTGPGGETVGNSK